MDYNKLKVAELKSLFQERNLDFQGRKADLIGRLVEWDLNHNKMPPINEPHSLLRSVPETATSSADEVTCLSSSTEPVHTIIDIGDMTENERLALRRQKFGETLPEDEDAKKLSRAKRFALSIPELEEEKIRNRDARFGVGPDGKVGVIGGLVLDDQERERRKRRADRFGVLSPEDEESRKRKRDARFGAATMTANNNGIISGAGAESWEAKVAARQLRFGAR